MVLGPRGHNSRVPKLRRWPLAAGLAALLAAPAAAQNTNSGTDKFAQLETLLPTPNTYRTASGAPGNQYWQQRADYTIRATLPALKDSVGHLVLTSSVAGRRALPGSLYSATKHAVTAMAESARQELNDTGVRVTSIEPGMVETEFTLVRNGGDQAASDALYAGANPMTAEDIADTIHYVATLPPHLNINALELMPVSQSWAGFTVTRKT